MEREGTVAREKPIPGAQAMKISSKRVIWFACTFIAALTAGGCRKSAEQKRAMERQRLSAQETIARSENEARLKAMDPVALVAAVRRDSTAKIEPFNSSAWREP